MSDGMGRTYLDVRYDVTALTEEQRGELALEAQVQAERSDGHPSVEVEIDTVEADSPTREILVHLNIEVPADEPLGEFTEEQIAKEIAGVIEVAALIPR